MERAYNIDNNNDNIDNIDNINNNDNINDSIIIQNKNNYKYIINRFCKVYILLVYILLLKILAFLFVTIYLFIIDKIKKILKY